METRQTSGAIIGNPRLVVKIHLWDRTDQIDSKGYFITKDHALVTLQFLGLEELKLQGFNHQNVIFGLAIHATANGDSGDVKFHVEFDPSFGIDAVFDCSAIEVVDASPLTESGADA